MTNSSPIPIEPRTIEARFWRMLAIPYQHEPLSGAGAARVGGRWNRFGVPTLYLSADHATAITEYHQVLIHPGTLVAYNVKSAAVIDLTDAANRRHRGVTDTDLSVDWRRMWGVERRTPPGWLLTDALIAEGIHGILVPSVACPGGTNLVLWRWSATGDHGARVAAIDPHGDLRG